MKTSFQRNKWFAFLLLWLVALPWLFWRIQDIGHNGFHYSLRQNKIYDSCGRDAVVVTAKETVSAGDETAEAAMVSMTASSSEQPGEEDVAMTEEMPQPKASIHMQRRHFQLLEAVPGRTRFRFELGDYRLERRRDAAGREYTFVQVPDGWHLDERGKPALPVFRTDLLLPTHGGGRLVVHAVDTVEVDGPPPWPAKGDAPWGTIAEEAAPQPEIYEGTEPWPPQSAILMADYSLRGVRGVGVQLFPCTYHPDTQRFIICRSMEVELLDEATVPEDYAMADREWNFAALQRTRFLNAPLLYEPESGGSMGSLLILCPDSWLEATAAFAAWKRSIGYEVRAASYPTDTGSGETALRQYVAERVTADGVTHVMLCGDVGDIPPAQTYRYVNYPGTTLNPTSDRPYAFVMGDDCYADVFLARLPAHSATQLEAALDKLQNYEAKPPTDDQWRAGVFFLGSDTVGTTGITNGVKDY